MQSGECYVRVETGERVDYAPALVHRLDDVRRIAVTVRPLCGLETTAGSRAVAMVRGCRRPANDRCIM